MNLLTCFYCLKIYIFIHLLKITSIQPVKLHHCQSFSIVLVVTITNVIFHTALDFHWGDQYSSTVACEWAFPRYFFSKQRVCSQATSTVLVLYKLSGFSQWVCFCFVVAFFMPFQSANGYETPPNQVLNPTKGTFTYM